MSPPSGTPLPPPTLPHRSRLLQSTGWAPCVTAASHQLSILHMVMDIFQCYSLNACHSFVPPLCTQVHIEYLYFRVAFWTQWIKKNKSKWWSRSKLKCVCTEKNLFVVRCYSLVTRSNSSMFWFLLKSGLSAIPSTHVEPESTQGKMF